MSHLHWNAPAKWVPPPTLGNVMCKMEHYFVRDNNVPVFCEDLPTFLNDNNDETEHEIICNNEYSLKLYRHPSTWFHAFKYQGQPKIMSYFVPKARND